MSIMAMAGRAYCKISEKYLLSTQGIGTLGGIGLAHRGTSLLYNSK